MRLRVHSCAIVRNLITFVLLFAVVGCKPSPKSIGEEAVDVSPFEPTNDNSDWPDAIRLSNGAVKVQIVPSIGRVMRFGFADGPNVLWTNPQLSRADVASTQPARKNWGGDRAWPWPQDEWPLRLGRTWPPPTECDQAPMAARLVGGLGARLESEAITGYGVKLVREIQLDARVPRVTFVSRFELASADLPPAELAAWQITQVPFPTGATIYAKLTAGRRIIGLPPSPWDNAHAVAPGVVMIDPPPLAAGKIGVDADALAWRAGDTLLIARSPTAGAAANRYRTGERAQVYVQAAPPQHTPQQKKPAPDAPIRFAELEFTSPRKDLAKGQVPELKVTWELRRIDGSKWKDADVAKIFNGG